MKLFGSFRMRFSDVTGLSLAFVSMKFRDAQVIAVRVPQ